MKAELDAGERAIRRQAAEWLARFQAGRLTLTPPAQLAEWRAADPRQGQMVAAAPASWGAFDRLAEYPHSADRVPDPDLFKPGKRQLRWRVPLGLAAAGLAVAAVLWFRPGVEAEAPVALAATTVLQLPDGSAVELNRGAQVIESFTAAERRVRLVQGEAHFTVAKNPLRPFIVEAHGVAVRAVGTAFNVRMDAAAVEVLVTEGTVAVAQAAGNAPFPGSNAGPGAEQPNADGVVPIILTVGQRTRVSTVAAAGPAAQVVETLGLAQIDQALAWQVSRFTFDDKPLEDVVAQYNQRALGTAEAPRIEFGDEGLRAVRVSGRIRIDQSTSLIEVLESSFGIRAETAGPGTLVLRRAPGL